MTKITTLFLDIGGVLLTNGWDRKLREKASIVFGFDNLEFEKLHQQYYNFHETDQISLDEYVNKTLFWKPRNFTIEEFKQFLYEETKPFKETIDLFNRLKREYHLKIATVSNEGRELAEYRIRTFHLTSFIDAFFVSAFVQHQKPDPQIYKIALDVMQVAPENVIYVDDRQNLIDAGKAIGLNTVWHQSCKITEQEIMEFLK